MLRREWGAESNGKLPHLFILGKTAVLVPEFAVEDLPSADLQPSFLNLQRKTCFWERTATLVPEFEMEDLPSAEMQSGSCACSERPALGQNTLMTMN